MRRWQFVAGKALAGVGLLAGGLALVLGGLTLVLHLMSGIGLTADDLLRIAVVWGVAVTYTACFFLLSFILTLHMKQPSHALLVAFAVWLLLVSGRRPVDLAAVVAGHEDEPLAGGGVTEVRGV